MRRLIVIFFAVCLVIAGVYIIIQLKKPAKTNSIKTLETLKPIIVKPLKTTPKQEGYPQVKSDSKTIMAVTKAKPIEISKEKYRYKTAAKTYKAREKLPKAYMTMSKPIPVRKQSYIPHAYLAGATGSGTNAELDLLQPILLTSSSNLFLYGQSRYGFAAKKWDHNNYFASLGLGWRNLVANKLVLGAFVLADYNKTNSKHALTLLSPGIEMFTKNWEMHANAYIPLGNKEQWQYSDWADKFGNYNYLVLKGHTRYDAIFTYHEETGTGADLEIGRTLFSIHNVLVKAYLDGYFYNMHHNRNIYGSGAKLKIEPTSYLSINAIDSFDNYDRNTFVINMQLSFYDLFAKTKNNDLHNKLFAPIDRNFGTISSGSNVRDTGGPDSRYNDPSINPYNPKPHPGPNPYVEDDNAWYFIDYGDGAAITEDKRRQGDPGTIENPIETHRFNQSQVDAIYKYNQEHGYDHADLYFTGPNFRSFNGSINLYKKFSINGMATAKYLKQAQGTQRPTFGGTFNLASDETVNDVQFNAPNAGLNLVNALNVTLNDVNVFGNPTHAIDTNNSYLILGDNNTTTGGISSKGDSTIAIVGDKNSIGNTITTSGGDSVQIKGSDNTVHGADIETGDSFVVEGNGNTVDRNITISGGNMLITGQNNQIGGRNPGEKVAMSSAGTLSLGGTNNTLNNVLLTGAGTELDIAGSKNIVNSDLTVPLGTSVNITGSHDAINADDIYVNGGILKITDTGANNTLNAQTLNVDNGKFYIDGDSNKLNINTASLVENASIYHISGSNNTIDNAIVLDGIGSDLTVGGTNNSFNNTISVTDGATFELAGNSNTLYGDVTASQGAITISGSDDELDGSIYADGSSTFNISGDKNHLNNNLDFTDSSINISGNSNTINTSSSVTTLSNSSLDMSGFDNKVGGDVSLKSNSDLTISGYDNTVSAQSNKIVLSNSSLDVSGSYNEVKGEVELKNSILTLTESAAYNTFSGNKIDVIEGSSLIIAGDYNTFNTNDFLVGNTSLEEFVISGSFNSIQAHSILFDQTKDITINGDYNEISEVSPFGWFRLNNVNMNIDGNFNQINYNSLDVNPGSVLSVAGSQNKLTGVQLNLNGSNGDGPSKLYISGNYTTITSTGSIGINALENSTIDIFGNFTKIAVTGSSPAYGVKVNAPLNAADFIVKNTTFDLPGGPSSYGIYADSWSDPNYKTTLQSSAFNNQFLNGINPTN